jgi:hypothetical protein
MFIDGGIGALFMQVINQIVVIEGVMFVFILFIINDRDLLFL